MKKWLLSLPLCLLAATATSCAQIDKIVKEYEAKKEATQAESDQIRNADLDNPVASLSVEQISDEFESNSVLAEDKYMNKPVEISGYIGSIDDSMFGEDEVGIQITSGGEFSMASVACSVPRKSPIVAQLKKGDRVAVRGVITSEEMGIGMSRCKFYDYKTEQWIGGSAATRTSIASAKNTETIASNKKMEDLGYAVGGEKLQLDLASINPNPNSANISFRYSLGNESINSIADCGRREWMTLPERKLHSPKSAATERMLSRVCDAFRSGAPVISTSGAAIVFDPPSNIRTNPNGGILCSITSKGTIPIQGKRGDWYETDYCGSPGYIHKGQVRF